ncbi:MAG: Transcriptional and/or translational regulatory protein YebC/TACO1 [Chloroflexi bacterium]|jgi:YebC/PmpR family DNA-binding regulatory protein|nr:MAG: Transcriptional and/or translational regulatory protein YebC/TACO1 [Chloroflexota bacterium]
MSGHSKWSTIKHGKAISDARRGKLFTKFSKEIIVAARAGGGEVETNFKLRMAVQRAKDANMPADTIDRAIQKGSGKLTEEAQLTEMRYEGYGPGGTAILLEALTDNKNRTASDVRSTFSKGGGNLAEVGSVAWQFEQKAVFVVKCDHNVSEGLAMIAIDAGAADFDMDDSIMEIYSSVEQFDSVQNALNNNHAEITSSGLSMIPLNTVELDLKSAKPTLRLLEQLEDLDDVQRVYSNGDFPQEAIEQYGR